MKRKEPEPSEEAQTGNQANQANSSSSVHEHLPPSKRAKLRESDTKESQPVAPAILERFASASRQRIAQLLQQGSDSETALDHLVSQLTTSSISDQTPSYTLADIKIIRKLTGFSPSQAERVLLLREEICLLSRQLSVDPADVVDTLTDRLTSETLPNLKKRHREGLSSIESTLERPQKRLRDSDERRTGKRSFSDMNDISASSEDSERAKNGSSSSNATPDLSELQKRRKIHETSTSPLSDFDFVVPTSLISPANPANANEASSSSSSSSALPLNSLVQSLQSAFHSRISEIPSQSCLDAHEVASASPTAQPNFGGSSLASPLPQSYHYEPEASYFIESSSFGWPGSPVSSIASSDKAPQYQASSSPPFFGFGPSSFPFAPPGAATAAATRGRSRLTESSSFDSRLDEVSSVHSDDRSVASSLQVHPSHSGEMHIDDGFMDDASSCASTSSSAPSRKSRGGGGDDSSSATGQLRSL